MEITREFLDEEAAGMRQLIQQRLAEHHMAMGALQVVEQLRARLDEPEPDLDKAEEEPDGQNPGHAVPPEGDCGDGGEPEAAEGHDA